MDEHTAQVFVKDTLFDITGMALAPHLWGMIPLSDVGIDDKAIPKLSLALGIDPTTVKISMTLEELVKKVSAESPLQVHVVKTSIFEWLLS